MGRSRGGSRGGTARGRGYAGGIWSQLHRDPPFPSSQSSLQSGTSWVFWTFWSLICHPGGGIGRRPGVSGLERPAITGGRPPHVHSTPAFPSSHSSAQRVSMFVPGWSRSRRAKRWQNSLWRRLREVASLEQISTEASFDRASAPSLGVEGQARKTTTTTTTVTHRTSMSTRNEVEEVMDLVLYRVVGDHDVLTLRQEALGGSSTFLRMLFVHVAHVAHVLHDWRSTSNALFVAAAAASLSLDSFAVTDWTLASLNPVVSRGPRQIPDRQRRPDEPIKIMSILPFSQDGP